MYTVHGIRTFFKQLTRLCLQSLHHRLIAWTKPNSTSLLLATLTDLARSKSELMAENALLRQQLIMLRRQVKRPAYTKTDRMLLVLLASIVRTWKQALLIIQPETLLRWHRYGIQLFWKYKSRASSLKPRISEETVALIKQMARDNRLWGAERILGELLKLGIHVCKRTIQKYMRSERTTRPHGQTLRQHQQQLLACDFFTVETLGLKTLYVLYFLEISIRRIHVAGCTVRPTATWVTQQARQLVWKLQEEGRTMRFLLHDRDMKFPTAFDVVFASEGIKVILTPYRTPNANAYAERWVRSVREECLDHLLLINERHIEHVLWEYSRY